MQDSIIKKVIITEKAGLLQQGGQYVFMVEPSANKNEIKKAIKTLYRVDVVDIQTLRRRAKYKRFRQSVRLSAPLKKAIITLKEGQKIDTQ